MWYYYLTIMSMKTPENTTITPDSLLLLIREMALSFDKQLKESQSERLESEARFDREIEKSRAERAESAAKFEQEMAESRAEFDRRSADFDRRMKILDEMIGGVGNSNGMAAEELFFNTLDNSDKKIFGEQFDLCYRNLNFNDKGKKKKNEFDIILVNCKSMALVEVKYKARREDVQRIIDKVLDFKIYFPHYNCHQVYLGLAAMSFEKGVETVCANNGIAIIKQVGDEVLIEDKNLKVF